MNRVIAYCGSALAVATSVYFLYQSQNKIKFKRIKLLNKESLLFLFKEIRKDYSKKFFPVLKSNRKRRRGLKKGGREYRSLIKDLKEQSKEFIERSIEETLLKNSIAEEILAESYKFYQDDEDIKSALSKICSIKSIKNLSIPSRTLTEILDYYISEVESFEEADPTELNIKMKMLEDQIYEEYRYEPEEIEAATYKCLPETEGFIKIIKELNTSILKKTSQSIFF